MYGLEEVQAALEAMQAPMYTLSSYTKRFQEEFADFVGTKYAFAVTNAASALEMAAFLVNTAQGLNVMARAHAGEETVQGIVKTALALLR